MKNKSFFKGLGLVVVTSIITTFVLTNFGFLGFVPINQYNKYKKAIKLGEVIERDFYKKPNEKELSNGLCKGLFYGLNDVYSSYYTSDEMKQLLEMSSGKYVGVGISVGPDQKTKSIKIQEVFEKSPAEKSGLQKGDFILKINGKTFTYQELDLAVKNMKGEAGTPVDLTIMRDGELLNKKVIRQEIKLILIESKVYDKDIGYIKIKAFEDDTAKDFDKALASLEKEKIKALIIDVRNDGGGLLTSVQSIADRLLGEAVIVYTQNNKGEREYLKSNNDEKINLPIVVLTNENTASASEILTGAILDNKAGISMGTTTFGKGLVQEVVQLRDGSGYKLTTAQYFTPNGNYINKKGIKPTIEVKDESKQIPKAIEYLKEKIK